MEKGMKKYPWRPCTNCMSVSNRHYRDIRNRCGYSSWCAACARVAKQISGNPVELGDPSVNHRHLCEACRSIFDCQPCPHFGTRDETSLPRICPKCAKQERKAS